MFRRLANSIAMEWRQHQSKPKYTTITDFHAAMGENNLAKVMRLISCNRPTL